MTAKIYTTVFSAHGWKRQVLLWQFPFDVNTNTVLKFEEKGNLKFALIHVLYLGNELVHTYNEKVFLSQLIHNNESIKYFIARYNRTHSIHT